MDRWLNPPAVNRRDAFISGDPLTDLRTKKNKLSVWKADTKEDIEDAIVALALSRDKVQKLCYVLLDESYLEKVDINMEFEKGGTHGLPNSILIKHRNLTELDYWRLGYLCEYMISVVSEKSGTMFKQDVDKLLKKYKENGIIKVEEVDSRIKEDLGW